jgi:quercetin dioxygenase-like cupin family protein
MDNKNMTHQVIVQPLGDMVGKREHAIADAHRQLALQEEGSVRAKLYALQAACGELPEVDFPLLHTFAPDAYARTIFLPAGSVIVGKIHKHAHLNVLCCGKVAVGTETDGIELLEGPLTMVSPPGTKRGVYAITDAVWVTIHVTPLTDLAEIEDFVIAKTYEDYDEFLKTQVKQ